MYPDTLISGGSKGGARDAPPGPKFFQFHEVLGKIWQNRMLEPPGELAPPPRGNPGSATANVSSRNHQLTLNHRPFIKKSCDKCCDIFVA